MKKRSKPSSKMKMSSSKAKKMLKHGSAKGHSLTKKQRALLGAVAGSGKR